MITSLLLHFIVLPLCASYVGPSISKAMNSVLSLRMESDKLQAKGKVGTGFGASKAIVGSLITIEKE